ncbi:Diaminopimelate decarboxylase [Rubripirellula tenax]|uniref:Diaminopimelate decarboxylase n=1 Tax=Rubripirellula tenax TaxID=2528015 RepID=A0A5C6FFW0_9BACT|nr:diaminopimelate decarboxylase [Rubripirellula tenax]TWU59006.1 Diaminopimelate decarboxylase [Rubripirellula tenax]
MSAFHQRISPPQIESIFAKLASEGFLGDDVKSVIVHDVARMQQRIAMLQDAFPDGTLHAIAIKANPVVEILRAAVDAGAGLEAASIEEVTLALAAGCPPDRIIFDSPAKTVAEIRQTLERGIHVNVDNFDELDRVALILKASPSDAKPTSTIGLRVTPEVGAGSISHTSVGNRGSKFGVSISRDREQILAAFARHAWLVGLHIHVGSQGCPMEQLCDAAEKIESLRQEIQSHTGRAVPVVDIGGGLPAPYDDDHQPASPDAYAAELGRRVPTLFDGNVRLVTEFGRSVQAGCGLALSRVEYVRDLPAGDAGEATCMAVIHLGADFLVRPVYRPQDWSHEYAVLDASGRLRDEPDDRISIGGPLCFGGDIPARNVAMPRPRVGDWIAIRDCGAYTLSMWSRHCSRGIPDVIGYDGEARSTRLLRAAESPGGIARFWSAGEI